MEGDGHITKGNLCALSSVKLSVLVPFEGLKQGRGWSDLFPRKSYGGKMFIQDNLSEENRDPRKTFSHLY